MNENHFVFFFLVALGYDEHLREFIFECEMLPALMQNYFCVQSKKNLNQETARNLPLALWCAHFFHFLLRPPWVTFSVPQVES